MVRNKSQGRDGLNDNRGAAQDDRLNNDQLKRSGLHEDEQRENTRKPDKSTQKRKGSPGKTR